jgi:autotransporter translocation and assembly factor TamB
VIGGKSVLRWTGIALVGVVITIGIAVAVLPLWLRTSHGHRTVERALTSLLNERVPGSVSVGRIGGDVVHGLRVEDVTVCNPRGERLGHADWIAARWQPMALLRRREVERVIVSRPTLTLDRGTWRGLPGPPSRPATIQTIDARDGEVTWKSARFEHVTGTATLHTESNLDVHALTALLDGTALGARGTVAWSGQAPWVATELTVERRGVLDGHGKLFYAPGRLEGTIDRMTLAAPFMTKLVGGSGPLDVRVEATGAPDRLRVVAHGAQGERRLQLSALVDGVARSAMIDADLTGAPRPIRLHGRVRYADGALGVPMVRASIGGSRLEGSGRLRGRRVHAALDLRISPAEARLISLRPTAPVAAHVEIDGPPRALEVQARAAVVDGRLLVRARCDLGKRRAHAEVIARDLQLAQLLDGAPPLTISTALTLDGRWTHPAIVAQVKIDQGTVSLRGRTVERLDGTGWVRIGSDGEAVISNLSGRFAGPRDRREVALEGDLRWTRERIALREASLALGDSRLVGEAEYLRDRSRSVVRVDTMTLAPELVAGLLRHRPRAPWTGRAALDGTPDDLAIRVEVATDLGPGTLTGRLRRAGGALELSSIDAHLGDSYLRGAAHFARGRLTASLRTLVLQPTLLHRLAPALEPTWPIRIQGAADGPLDRLDLALSADAGPSVAEVRGRISVAQRRFQLDGAVDSFHSSVVHRNPKRVSGSLQLTAQGVLARGGIVGTAAIRNVRGYALDSPFFRGAIDVRLAGRAFEITRARLTIPAARLAASGRGSLRGDFHLGYGAVITDAFSVKQLPPELRLLLGLNSILPGSTIEGAIDRRPGQKVRVSYRVVPIGVAQLRFLYRVVTGQPPVFRFFKEPSRP